MNALSRISLTTLLLASLTTEARSQGVDLEVIYARGDIAPGTNGAELESFFSPQINENGDIAFVAELEGEATPATERRALYLLKDNAVHLLARMGHPVTGIPDLEWINDTTFGSEMTLNNSGSVLFSTRVRTLSPSEPQEVLWSSWLFSDASQMELLRQGWPAPGTDGAVFSDIRNLYWLNDADSFIGKLELEVGTGDANSMNSDGIWQGNASNIEIVVRTGEPAIGPGSLVIKSLGTPRLNHDGDILFDSSLGDGPFSQDLGVWLQTSGETQRILQTGYEAPGIPGATIWEPQARGINSTGQVAVTSSMDPNDPQYALWVGTPTNLALIAKTSDPVPGVPSRCFHEFFDATLNERGDLLFRAQLCDDSNALEEALFVFADGVFRMIARGNNPAPGLDGPVFTTAFSDSFFRYGFNNRGDVIFHSTLRLGVGGVTTSNDIGLWIYDSQADQVRLVAREGELFDFSSDNQNPDLQPLRGGFAPYTGSASQNRGTGLADGAPRCLNNRGEFLVSFTSQDFSRKSLVLLTLPQADCPADLNSDGLLDLADITIFVQAFQDGESTADFNGDGLLDLADIVAFIEDFIRGCPES